VAASAYRSGTRLRRDSAVAAAAYRSGAALRDSRQTQIHDYRRRHGVLHSEILAPGNASGWMRARERLWNGVEACETRKDACVARELEVSLPRELDRAANMQLVRDFVRRELVDRGLVADVAWHSGAARDGGENIHAHILFTTRPVEGEGFGRKDRALDRKETLRHWRQAWAEHVNRTLEAAGSAARIDHRSLADQSVGRLPENLGRNSIALEQRGVETGQGDRWRDIRHRNKVTRHARPELARAIAAEAAELSAAQRRTHALLMLARGTYT
jgi:ATP-dependent exoDNAse (exonuclease V) alpha subunit